MTTSVDYEMIAGATANGRDVREVYAEQGVLSKRSGCALNYEITAEH